MNVKPTPTSPKAKLDTADTQVEKLYRDESLKQLQHPNRKNGLSLTTVVLSLVIGFLAGILGELVFNVYLLDEQSPLASFLLPNGVAMQSAQRVKTTQTIQQIAEDTQASMLSIYALKGVSDPVASVYTPSEKLGTASLITSDGWAVTTKNALGSESNFAVVTADRSVYALKNRIDDPGSDLVFFRIDGVQYPVVAFEETPPAVGDLVVLPQANEQAGAAPFRQAHVASAARPRQALESSDTLGRTHALDVSVPNSFRGGPALNLRGKVVGMIVESAEAETSMLPSAVLLGVLDTLLQEQSLVRSALGVRIIDVSAVAGIPAAVRFRKNQGALVAGTDDVPAVESGMPAAKAGVLSGDLLLKVDGTEITSETTLAWLIAQKQPGDLLTLSLLRDGLEKELRVTLGERTAPLDMEAIKNQLLRIPVVQQSLMARQVIKFLLVGATNTFWDYTLYIVLTRGWLGFELHFLAAQSVAFIGAVLNSYILNKRWTFRHDDPRHHILLGKFVMVNLVSLGLNELLLYLLVGHAHMYDLVAKAVVIIPVMAWNFFANKYWTFRTTTAPVIASSS